MSKLSTLLGTCRQLEAWLLIDRNFQGWPAAQSYLKQLQSDLEPFLCPTCKDILPESGPCWGCQLPGEEEETVTSEEMLEVLIPYQGEAYPAKVYSEFEEYF